MKYYSSSSKLLLFFSAMSLLMLYWSYDNTIPKIIFDNKIMSIFWFLIFLIFIFLFIIPEYSYDIQSEKIIIRPPFRWVKMEIPGKIKNVTICNEVPIDAIDRSLGNHPSLLIEMNNQKKVIISPKNCDECLNYIQSIINDK